MRSLNLSDGFSSSAQPVTAFTTTSQFAVYASDAAYVAALTAAGGSLAQGDAYLNSTDLQIHFYDGTIWRTAGGGGGGGALQWLEQATSPIPGFNNGFRVYSFEAAAAQEIWTTILVPTSYVAGFPAKLKLTWISPDTSGNVLVRAQSTLIRPGTDLVSSTTNQRTTTNAAVTVSGGTQNIPQSLSLDISSTTGQINGVALAPGHMIKVRLYRDTDTAASSVDVPVYGAEVTFQ